MFIGIEVKIDTEEPTPLQEWNLNKIKKAKGLPFVVKPNNWKKISELLTIFASEPHNGENNGH